MCRCAVKEFIVLIVPPKTEITNGDICTSSKKHHRRFDQPINVCGEKNAVKFFPPSQSDALDLLNNFVIN